MAGMGMYQASLGNEGQEKSGRAILARQRQGSIGSFVFTDHFEAALVYSAKVIVDLIPKIYNTERIIRIMGEDGKEQPVPINARQEIVEQQGQMTPQDMMVKPQPGITDYWNDLSIGKYDVTVTIGPSYTTQRQEAAEMLIELATAVPQLAAVAIDLIVKNLDLPGADDLLKRARRIVVSSGLVDLEPGEEPPPQPPPDPEVIAKMQELELKMGELQLKARKEDREDFTAAIDSIKKIAEAQTERMNAQINDLVAITEAIRANAEAQGSTQPQGQPPPAGGAPPPVSPAGLPTGQQQGPGMMGSGPQLPDQPPQSPVFQEP